MNNRPPRRRLFLKHGRRGAAAVEFAVVAPLFLLLLAGIIEFGQAFRIQHTLSSACRRGARASVVASATTSQVRQKVETYCVQASGVSEGDVTIEIAVNGDASAELSLAEEGDEISVAVSMPFSKAGVRFYANMLSNSKLSSTITLEHE